MSASSSSPSSSAYRFWAWSDQPPYHIGSCRVCGCIVLLMRFTDGGVALIDPPFSDRRWLRSLLTPAAVQVQGYASLGALGALHECPPPSERLLPPAPARAAAYRRASRALKGGSN